MGTLFLHFTTFLILLLTIHSTCAFANTTTSHHSSGDKISCCTMVGSSLVEEEVPQSSWVSPRAAPVLVQVLMVALAVAVPTGVVLSIVLCTGRPSCLLSDGPEPDACEDFDEDEDEGNSVPQSQMYPNSHTHTQHNTLLKSV